MTDIVYPLGKGSTWRNKELYYSMLSVKKFLKGYRNIYIIGEHPGFDGDFIHVPFPDRGDKDLNIYDKTYQACNIPELSDDFLFMNDDVFFCKPMHVKYIPDSYIGMLNQRMYTVGCPFYKQVLTNTYHALKSRNLPIKDFDGHLPIIYNKNLFKRTTKQFNWGVKHAYAVKSIYFNSLRIAGVQAIDLKIAKPENDIPALIANRWCFSIGDNGLTEVMKSFLFLTFED